VRRIADSKLPQHLFDRHSLAREIFCLTRLGDDLSALFRCFPINPSS
jgi:hypothetical protein